MGAHRWHELGHEHVPITDAWQGDQPSVVTSEHGHDVSRHVTVKNAMRRASSRSCVTNCEQRKSKQASTLIYFVLRIHPWLQILGRRHSLPESKVSRRAGCLPVPGSGHRLTSGSLGHHWWYQVLWPHTSLQKLSYQSVQSFKLDCLFYYVKWLLYSLTYLMYHLIIIYIMVYVLGEENKQNVCPLYGVTVCQ